MDEKGVAEALSLADLDDDGFVSQDEWLSLFFHGSPQVHNAIGSV